MVGRSIGRNKNM